MTIKSQDQCYRIINGERYKNACDVLGEFEQRIVEQVKAKKLRHRMVKHPSGFKICFVHEDDHSQIQL